MFYVPPTNGNTEDPDRAYTNGETGVPDSGSTVSAAFFNLVLAELLAILTAAGIEPDSEDEGQVVEAIATLIAAAVAAQALADLVDVTINSPVDGQALIYSGGGWQNATMDIQDTIARKRIAILAGYRAMDQAQAQYGLIDDAYEAFTDADGIDAGASSNMVWNAAGYVTNRSGDTILSGGTVFSSGVTSGDADDCFDADTATIAVSGDSAGGTLVVGKDFGTANPITRVKVWADWVSSSGTIAAEGSNNGSDYTTIGSQAVSGAGPHALDFSITATDYRYVRVTGTTNNNSRFMEIEIYRESDPAAGNLILEAVEALSEPTGAHFLALIDDVDSADPVANTDILGYLSKNDGGTWEAVTLALDGTTSEGFLIFSGSIADMSVTGDKTMRIRLATSARSEWRAEFLALQF